MEIKTAIKLAIEVGWGEKYKNTYDNGKAKYEIVHNGILRISPISGDYLEKSIYEILLEKDFWECLGKSEGWGEDLDKRCTKDGTMSIYSDEAEFNMHRFIDNLQQEQDINTAFDNATK